MSVFMLELLWTALDRRPSCRIGGVGVGVKLQVGLPLELECALAGCGLGPRGQECITLALWEEKPG
ncbi:MAG: hypothetical protein V3T08_07145 [Gemmatimonadota bacterium]